MKLAINGCLNFNPPGPPWWNIDRRRCCRERTQDCLFSSTPPSTEVEVGKLWIFFPKVHLEVAKETSLLLCTCRLAHLLCLQTKEIGRGKANKNWLYQDLSIQPKCSNLVFGLCGKISGRLRNLSGSPRDVVHVEEGIDNEEQVPLRREDKHEFWRGKKQFNSHWWDGAEIDGERKNTPKFLKIILHFVNYATQSFMRVFSWWCDGSSP